MVRPPLAAPLRTGSMLEPPMSESPGSTDCTVCTPDDRPSVEPVRASRPKYPCAWATAMSDCEKATFRPGRDTLLQAGCRWPALGVGEREVERELPHAMT